MPVVFDNLIHRKEMPVTIGIFVDPVTSASVPRTMARKQPQLRVRHAQRSYARFFIEEMLPEVGKKYNLTNDPGKRAIGGTSSGGICAFTVAWERPDGSARC